MDNINGKIFEILKRTNPYSYKRKIV